jgi:hypothetical protein
LLAAVVFTLLVGCHKPRSEPSTEAPAVATATFGKETGGTSAAPTPAKESGTSPSVGTSSNTGIARPTFDGERAFAQLKKQCDFGARPLGSDAHEKLRDYLVAEMKKYADETVTQEFKYRGMPVTNVIGVFYPAGSKEPSKSPVLLMAHWDTRPIADGPFSSEMRSGKPFQYGPNGWNRTTPIMGANDGASGVAVLLELARLFKEKKPTVGVVLLLDDGEDYGDFHANNYQGDGVVLGARYFARHFHENKAFGQPNYGILLDMIGAKNLILPREAISQQYAPGTNEKVFDIAKSLGYSDVFRYQETQQVDDDHLPLNEAGIPTIDLIHPLPYNEYQTTGYVQWHTLQDTPDKCSAKSLKIVGETMAEVIYRETN